MSPSLLLLTVCSGLLLNAGLAHSYRELQNRHKTHRYCLEKPKVNHIRCVCLVNSQVDCKDVSLSCLADDQKIFFESEDDFTETSKAFEDVNSDTDMKTMVKNYGDDKYKKPECDNNAVEKSKLPENCRDLRDLGHSLNGYYPVRGASNNELKMLFCNFNKKILDPRMDLQVGNFEIKTSPVQFYVISRKSPYQPRVTTPNSPRNPPVPFEIELLNIGGAMDSASGIFTVPQSGVYQFNIEFDGYGQVIPPNRRACLSVNQEFLRSSCQKAKTEFDDISGPVELKLTVGDQVNVELADIGFKILSRDIKDDPGAYLDFSGVLVKADDPESLPSSSVDPENVSSPSFEPEQEVAVIIG